MGTREVLRMGLAALCLTGLSGPAGVAWAGEVEADARLTAVTVFPGSAEVIRVATVKLPAGESTIVVPDLAPFAEDTLQADGSGDVPVSIVRVEVARRHLTEQGGPAERKLRDRIRALEDEKRAANDRIAAQRARVDFIRNVINTSPPSVKEGMLRDDPGKWQAAWAFIGDGMGQALAAIQKEEIALRGTDAEIRRLREELRQIATGSRMVLDVRVNVTAKSAGEFRLSLKHTVNGATWTPRYDLRLDADAGRVAITQQGEVRNRTGEDWNRVALRLSTTRPAQGVAMEEPNPWFIDFRPPLRRARGEAESDEAFFESLIDPNQATWMDSRGFIAGSSDVNGFAGAPAAPVEQKAQRVAAVAEVAEFTAEYAIHGRQDIPADGEPHTFTVAEHGADAALLVRTWPARRAAAYLYAKLTYGGETPLPAGPATVFRDGVMVGRHALPEVRPGEDIKLPFGVDDRVAVTHQTDSDMTGKGGIIGRKREVTRGYRIAVENFHKQPVDVTVYDRLPVPKNDDIRVKPLKDNTPDTTQEEPLPGVLAWEAQVPAGGRHDIRFGYEVSFPKDREVPGF